MSAAVARTAETTMSRAAEDEDARRSDAARAEDIELMFLLVPSRDPGGSALQGETRRTATTFTSTRMSSRDGRNSPLLLSGPNDADRDARGRGGRTHRGGGTGGRDVQSNF